MKSQNLFILLALVSLQLIGLQAQTYVDASATGTNDGSSWTNAYTDLGTALGAALSGDALWVAAGTYLPGNNPGATFRIDKNLSLYGGFNGTETMISQRNDSLNITILSGDINGDDVSGEWQNFKVDNSRNIMTMAGSINNSTVIDGFTFKGGHADTTVNYPARGGGAIISNGAPVISSCMFTENYADVLGGAIYLYSFSASGAQLHDCRFYQNKCNSLGGAMYLGTITGQNTLIRNCHFEANDAVRNGGGLRIYNSAVSVFGCDFLNNTSVFIGGGIAMYHTVNAIGVIVESCNFEGNISTLGGGLYAEPEGVGFTLDINNSQFRGNEAKPLEAGYSPSGAGLYTFLDPASTGATVSVIGSTFENNVTDRLGGGARFGLYGTNPSMNIENCEFLSNKVLGDVGAGGSGIQVSGGGSVSTAMIHNTNFEKNEGGVAGALTLEAVNNGDFDALISGCSFKENNTNDLGAGVAIIAYSGAVKSTSRIEDCSFEDNYFPPTSDPTIGAGLAMASAIDSFNVVVHNSTFNGNKNVQGGGAIEAIPFTGFLAPQHTDILLSNSLISNHDSALSAILIAGYSATLSNLTISETECHALRITDNATVSARNTIFNSLNHDDIELTPGSSLNSLGGNLVSDTSASQFLTAMDVGNEDPAFEGAGAHPFKIRFDSPAVDLGQFYPGFDPMSLDLAGNPRLHGSKVDAGAYESPFNTAIKDLIVQNTSLSLYPNPVTDVATLELNNEWKGSLSLRIFNVQGQEAFTTQLVKSDASFSYQLNLGWLPAGHYRLLLSDGQEAVVKAFVKR